MCFTRFANLCGQENNFACLKSQMKLLVSLLGASIVLGAKPETQSPQRSTILENPVKQVVVKQLRKSSVQAPSLTSVADPADELSWIDSLHPLNSWREPTLATLEQAR